MKNLRIPLMMAAVFSLVSCGSTKKAVKAVNTPAVNTPMLQDVPAKDVDVSVEVIREIYEPIEEQAKPNPIKLVSFVNVEDLLDLKGGMSMQEVTTKLGQKPFNIISSQNDGYTLVNYKYKKVHVILNDQNENQIGAKGQKEYGSKIDDAYLVFNRDGKLELVISKEAYEGAAGSNPSGPAADLLKAHRNLYNPTKNDGKLMIRL